MNSTQTSPDKLYSLPAPTQPEAIQASLSSYEILRGQKAVDIQHNGAIYKLQATRLGKLILTK